jgi:CHAT domain
MGAVVSAANRFLNTTIVFRHGTEDLVAPAGSPGDPNPAFGDEFSDVVCRHLRLDAVTDLAPHPQSLVALPGLPIPLQAVFAQELGWTPMLNVSFREPAPPRAFRQVVLLGDGATGTSTWELDIVEEQFVTAGATVQRVDPTRANFEAAYIDADVDVLWLASHGFFDHYQPDRSALHLGPGEELELDELVDLDVPIGGQRLLVLNTCDAGMSATLGGLTGFGLGPAIAGPHQAVVSNLWAVYALTAAAFGAELAASLARGSSIGASFTAALSMLAGGRDAISAVLQTCGPTARPLQAAVAQAKLPYDNLECWGAPTLMT